MKVIIVGNGVAGTFSAQNIRSLDKDVSIQIFTEEKYPYYTRVKLPELISGRATIEDLIVYDEEWHEKNHIKLNLNTKIRKIDTNANQIYLNENNEPLSYDKLILATGGFPSIPPLKNAKELIGKGVFTLRNIDDALEIKKFIQEKGVKKVVVIGGGLLGLELSRQIRNCDLDTTVVEFFPRLLPKQLDKDCGSFLKGDIEKMGIHVILDAHTQEILGDKYAKGIAIKDKPDVEADMVLIQAGVTPNIDLAKEANIETNKGIIVNNYLETSAVDVFAVGDCIEYEKQTWGIIPACIEQSKVIGASILGKEEKKYTGTVPKNTLKIVGIDLTSIGVFDPEDKDLVGAGWQILKNIDKKSNCYKKIVLKDHKLKGAILFGEKKGIPYINKHIESEVNEEELREAIEMFIWKCENCGYIYDEAEQEIPFKSLPGDWKCPDCNGPKENFKKTA